MLEEDHSSKTLVMQRGVSQLLFNYTPARTVDWEDGAAVVELGGVAFREVWQDDRAAAVLREIAEYRSRWCERGGEFDDFFPDPLSNPAMFGVGTPASITASYMRSALVCQVCRRLIFTDRNLSTAREPCPQCGSFALRQFPHVLVHGCGELVPVNEWVPASTSGEAEQSVVATQYPLRCKTCGPGSDLVVASRSERASDLKIFCRSCSTVAVDRILARCPSCLASINRRGDFGQKNTVVGRITMRLSRYSASDTYYPVSLSMLRLDKPRLSELTDPILLSLRRFLPVEETGAADIPSQIAALAHRATLFPHELPDIMRRIRELTEETAAPRAKPVKLEQATDFADDVPRALTESVAFRTSVVSEVIQRATDSHNVSDGDSTTKAMLRLGIRELSLIKDLPVIAATFGFTRRSFEPTYDETFAQDLPTRIRSFGAISRDAAAIAGRPELVGRIPILAREGEHEGIFVGVDPQRIVAWLEGNNANLQPGETSAERIIRSLEPIDRFYDGIWDASVRRLVFGLLHTLSHVAMKAVSRFAGVERTSACEYIFIPLLGFVIYDGSGTFQLGGIENLAREYIHDFIGALETDEISCLYDPDCGDRTGACHGCIHSPEIACRVFNHGLSRAFLVGGHAPWRDAATEDNVRGFWDV